MKTSETLKKLLDYDKEDITIRELCRVLSEKGFSFIILLMALPNVIPNVPGISSTTSIVIIFISIQMILGLKAVWLPEFIYRKKIPASAIKKVVRTSLSSIKFVEKFLKERASLFKHYWERIIGAFILILALVMLLPIPFMNFIVAVPICLLALGFLAKDGFFILFSFIFSIAMLLIKYNLILAILDKIFSYFA